MIRLCDKESNNTQTKYNGTQKDIEYFIFIYQIGYATHENGKTSQFEIFHVNSFYGGKWNCSKSICIL